MELKPSSRAAAIICIALSAASVSLLSGLRPSYRFDPGAFSGSGYREDALRSERIFPDEHMAAIGIEGADLRIADSLEARVLAAANATPGVMAVAPGEDDAWGLGALARSPDGRARMILLRGDDPEASTIVAQSIVDGLRGLPGARAELWSEQGLDRGLRQRTARDLRVVTSIAGAIVLAIYLLMVRRLSLAIRLWLASILPALWTTAVFPLLGLEFRAESMLVPVEVLALSTSYAIQYFRHATREARGDAAEIFRVILLSAGTTILGFASLALFPASGVVQLGFLLGFGIAVAALFALFLLPSILAADPAFAAFRSPPARRLARSIESGLVPAVAIVCLVLACLGALRLEISPATFTELRDDDPFERARVFFTERFAGFRELSIVVEGAEPDYFVDVARVEGLRLLVRDVDSLQEVGAALGPPALIDEVFRTVWGQDRGPATLEEVGETIELGRSAGEVFSLDSLLSVDGSAARILVWCGESGLDDALALRARLSALASKRFPEAQISVAGLPIATAEANRSLVIGLSRSVLSFMPVLALIFALSFRSLRTAFVAMIPPLAGLGTYLGLAGWLGYPLGISEAIGLAAVQGVSCDDVIHLLAGARRSSTTCSSFVRNVRDSVAQTGRSIVETTGIIVAGMGCVAFSAFPSLTKTGLLIAASLCAATVASLAIVPRLVGALYGREAREREALERDRGLSA